MNYEYKEEFRKELVDWFNREKRELPWRQTTDPYKIWVSEVMLQQTRVETVIPYYKRFLERFPTPEIFAYAPQEDILKIWEGLGYYSRVRNLQAGVREVVETYGGVVPDNRVDISKLKGVGPYTAGAVLSIAYGKPEHAVDGNVMRVLSRVLHIYDDIALPKTKKVFEQAVMALIDPHNASSFNQGLMELGALICTPTSPKCLLCPVREYCRAFEAGDAAQLPVKTKKSKMKNLSYKVYLARDKEGRYLLEKRGDSGLLANMWQFPMIELKEGENPLEVFSKQYEVEVTANPSAVVSFKHVFSHLTWHLEAEIVEVEAENTEKFFLPMQIDELPMPVPMLKIWHEIR